MSFGIYAIGFAVLAAGLGYGAYLMHIPSHWIVAGMLVVIGLGVMSAVKATRLKDPS